MTYTAIKSHVDPGYGTCSHKKRYPSAEHAGRSLQKLLASPEYRGEKPNTVIEVYLCKCCKLYHIGRRYTQYPIEKDNT